MVTTLGIDLGTSAVKAVVLKGAAVVATAETPLGIQHPRPGWAEQEPDSWVAAARTVLAELRQSNPTDFARIAAIGLSGQMHGLVALGVDDKPLRPAILWNDSRANAEAAEISVSHPHLAALAGVKCMASFVAPKLVWMARHEAALFGQMRRFIMPKDYLRLWLTGDHATDMVDAAGAWLLDEQSRGWSEPIRLLLGVDATVYPRLLEGLEISGSLRPDLAFELGLAAGLPVMAGAGDAAAAALGLGMVEPGDAFISLGTSCQLFVTTDTYRPAITTLVHAYAHALPERWFQMAAMLNGGSVLAWWSAVAGSAVPALIAEASEEGYRPDDPLFLPYLAGERTPHDDPLATGLFHGLTSSTSRKAMTRAVLEGVAFSLADAQDALGLGTRLQQEFGLTGGGARNDFWAQLIADVLQVPIKRYGDSRAGPALGAARLAQSGLGGGANAEAFAKPSEADGRLPNKAEATRLELRLEQWRGLYKRKT